MGTTYPILCKGCQENYSIRNVAQRSQEAEVSDLRSNLLVRYTFWKCDSALWPVEDRMEGLQGKIRWAIVYRFCLISSIHLAQMMKDCWTSIQCMIGSCMMHAWYDQRIKLSAHFTFDERSFSCVGILFYKCMSGRGSEKIFGLLLMLARLINVKCQDHTTQSILIHR